MKQESSHCDPDLVYNHILAEEYSDAYSLLETYPECNYEDSILLFFKAICAYEKNLDLECLRLLTAFLIKDPEHPKRNYCLFTAATCMANFGMDDSSLLLLNMIADTYPDLNEAKEKAKEGIARRNKAKTYYEALLKV